MQITQINEFERVVVQRFGRLPARSRVGPRRLQVQASW
jgi:hypothetical protein